jgi:hypothetical protein
MSDEADRSDQKIADAIEQAIMQARSAPALRPNGKCHFCDEPVAAPLLFCDMDCAQDFEAEEDQLKRMGR